MSISLKELRRKILDLQGIKKITFAMKLVAASKLKNSRIKAEGSSQYKKILQEILLRVYLKGGIDPLVEGKFSKENQEKLPPVVLLLSSDRGLCGSFNSLLFKKVEEFVTKMNRSDLIFAPIGKKSVDFCRRGSYSTQDLFPFLGKYSEFELADRIAMQLRKDFLLKKIGSVFVCFNEFVSTINQVPVVRQVLPIKLDCVDSKTTKKRDFLLVEPSVQKVFSDLIWDFLVHEIFCAVVHNKASENAARMVAMDNATQNVMQMLDKTVLQRNRIRQASITAEINEIVAASESV